MLWGDPPRMRWSFYSSSSSDSISLRNVLRFAVKARPHEIEAPEEMLELGLAGDWVVRADAPRENVLRDLGFRICRVRHHETLARLELGRDEIPRALEPEMADAIDRQLRALGYRHVTIDLRGYRLGSLNDALRLRPV